MWFQFELPEPVTLAEMQFQFGGAPGWGRAQGVPAPPPGTPAVIIPRAYRVQMSMDGSTWSAPVAEVPGSAASSVIAFAPAKTKFVRITQTATADSAPPWSIQQLQLLELRSR